MKIVVPDQAVNWQIAVADSTGTTIWGIDTNGNPQSSNPLPLQAQSAEVKITYPHNAGGSNALMIGDPNMTLGCYGGVSIIVPANADPAIYAIAVVNSQGDLLWGVDQNGQEHS